MTTRFRVADRVRATHHHRRWLGTAGGTVTAVSEATEEQYETVTVIWDTGASSVQPEHYIERIGIR